MQRLGVIIPSSNTTVEKEFSDILHGTKVSLHFARIPLSNVTIDGLLSMEKQTESAAQLLKDANVDAVAFACTSGSLIKGKNHDLLIAKKIFKVLNCPVVVTSGAAVDALKKIRAHKISLATPYIEEINKKEQEFFAQNELEVIMTESLSLTDNLEIGRLTPTDAAALAIKANSSLADAIFISCTNFATFDEVSKLETQLKKPVISSNSATLWASLNALQLKIHLPLGKLFEI